MALTNYTWSGDGVTYSIPRALGDTGWYGNSGVDGFLASLATNAVSRTGTQTLTNKTISGSSNTLSSIGYSSLSLTGSIVNADVSSSAAIAYSKLNLATSIVNADISASAAIARSKVAAGTASHVVINDGSGNLSSEATLAKSRGGAGADMSSVTFPSSGTLAVTFASSQVLCDTGNGHGSTNNKIRIFTNATTTGSDISYATSATNGDTFTINTAGLYQVSYTDTYSVSNFNLGISINSNQLTTSVASITQANKVLITSQAGGLFTSVAAVIRCAVNDVIRAHTDGTPNGATANVQFRIVRIG